MMTSGSSSVRPLPPSVTDTNPFVRIAPFFRAALIVYVLVFLLVPPFLEGLFYDTRPWAVPITLMELLQNLLLYGPLLFFPQRALGWLHPLVLPVVIGITIKFGRGYAELLTIYDFASVATYRYVGLEAYGQDELGLILLRKQFILVLFQLCYLLAYFGLRRLATPTIRLVQPSLLWVRLVVAGLIGAAAAAYIIRLNGGIQATIIGLAGGRFRFRESIGGGHFITLTKILQYAWLIWYAYRPKAIYNPFFWVYVFGSLATIFIVSGSRTGIFTPLIFLGLIYVIHTRKIPVFSMVVLGVVGVLTIGALGFIRTSGNRGDSIDLAALSERSLEEHLSSTQEEVSARVSGSTMVVGKAMDKVGPLYGRTYLAAIFFFIPRAIWANKPRGAGAYAGSLLFYDGNLKDNASGGKALGIPVKPQFEAYWNFWYPGVVFMSGLFGLFHRYLYNLFLAHRRHPLLWIIYIMGIGFTSFATANVVAFVQGVAMVMIVALLAHLWRPAIVLKAVKMKF